METSKLPLVEDNYKPCSPSSSSSSSSTINQGTSETYNHTSLYPQSEHIEDEIHTLQEKPLSIRIKLTNTLLKEDIIDSFNFLPNRNILHIKFNDRKYHGTTVILSTMYTQTDWNKLLDVSKRRLEQKLIEKQDIDHILNCLDENYNIILDENIRNTSHNNNNNSNKTNSDLLFEIINEKIDLLFKDQYNEAFVWINVNNDHYEIMSINSRKFARFLTKSFYEQSNGQIISKDALSSIIDTLQARAEFGDIRYGLSLRVAEYDGDFYYDLTDEKHRCIRISKKEGIWQILDKTPIPLFRRYNQIPQDVFSEEESEKIKEGLNRIDLSLKENPLDKFLSKMTNIRHDDEGTKLLIKVVLMSYFIPDIPHPIMILHGSAGSAKSTLQFLLKNIVDPAKPSLLTLHNNSTEFIQQLAHNYLATYDNLKYNPYWLADEVCKAVTGVGQTKRMLYTDDDDKIYEYKHCLIFNGINIAFSEPDVLDRSIVIHLDEIDDEKRKTEKEILVEFYSIKPLILKFIFDTLSKAIVIKDRVLLSASKLPRMADFAIWGEAILQAWGYKEGKFLKVYYDNMNQQNDEVIDSNPVAFAIRKLIDEKLVSSYSHSHSSNILFEGTPLDLLDELNRISTLYRINTISKDWPKDVKWLVRRINTVKSNIHKALNIKIKISRSSRDNTSKILLIKNVQ